jgi:hypothetical protein
MAVRGPRRRYHRRLAGLAFCAALLALCGCFSPDIDYTGKACDLHHLCPDGYQCLDAACQPLDAGAR